MNGKKYEEKIEKGFVQTDCCEKWVRKENTVDMTDGAGDVLSTYCIKCVKK